MSIERAELKGTGFALAFHVALIAALSINLARVATPPESPPMEVELVDEIALTSAAPQSATPPPPSQAPEIGQAEPIEPTPAPMITAAPPPPTITPTPPRPTPTARPAPPVKRQVRPAPAKPAPARPARPAPRTSRIGDDFLKGIAADAPSKSRTPAKAAAATFNAAAKADIGQAILRQVKSCADRQPYIGEGANQIRLTVNLKLNRAGRLTRPPTVLRTSGDEDVRAKYGDLLEDQVQRIFAECTPLRLPAELYDTPTGGWGNFTFIYRVD